MKNYLYLFFFLILHGVSNSQVGYKNYYLTESLDSIVLKLESAGIKYEKYDTLKYDRIKIVNGKFVPAGNEFKAIFGKSKNEPFVAQITCTRINYEEDSGINVNFYFDYKNKLMQIIIGDIEIEYDVLKETLTKKYGEPENIGNDRTEFKIPKFNTIIELSYRTTPYVKYKNTDLINSHFLRQYKEQKLAADKELKKNENALKDF